MWPALHELLLAELRRRDAGPGSLPDRRLARARSKGGARRAIAGQPRLLGIQAPSKRRSPRPPDPGQPDRCQSPRRYSTVPLLDMVPPIRGPRRRPQRMPVCCSPIAATTSTCTAACSANAASESHAVAPRTAPGCGRSAGSWNALRVATRIQRVRIRYERRVTSIPPAWTRLHHDCHRDRLTHSETSAYS